MKKTISLLGALLLFTLAGCQPIDTGGGPAPVQPGPNNLVVYAGFDLANAHNDPVGGVIHVVMDAHSGDEKRIGPGTIDQNINTNNKSVSVGRLTDSGGWEYPIGISRGVGSVTISLTVTYFASPGEILRCYLSSLPEGHGHLYDDSVKQLNKGTANPLKFTCFAVVTN